MYILEALLATLALFAPAMFDPAGLMVVEANEVEEGLLVVKKEEVELGDVVDNTTTVVLGAEEEEVGALVDKGFGTNTGAAVVVKTGAAEDVETGADVLETNGAEEEVVDIGTQVVVRAISQLSPVKPELHWQTCPTHPPLPLQAAADSLPGEALLLPDIFSAGQELDV